MERINKLVGDALPQTTQGENQTKIMPKNGIEQGVEFFNNNAKDMCPGYIMDQDNEPVIRMMVAYFQGNPDFVNMYQFANQPSLKKGILLMGNVGTGKTLIMQVFSRVMRQAGKFFPVITCRHVARQFQINGFQSLEEYGPKSFKQVQSEDYTKVKVPLTKCFDDLGCESDAFHFGNKVNVMQEVIFDRYDQIDKGMITHMTTNLNRSQIEEMYSDRAYSRMKQMFNVIQLRGDDRRS